eukprot:3621835-Alexandrium_andersonii.AAC.1
MCTRPEPRFAGEASMPDVLPDSKEARAPLLPWGRPSRAPGVGASDLWFVIPEAKGLRVCSTFLLHVLSGQTCRCGGPAVRAWARSERGCLAPGDF